MIDNQAGLVAYAKRHQYRTRNLHDGGPVPPVRRRKGAPKRLGYTGPEDRWDAIIGRRGYVAMDGRALTVSIFAKSNITRNRVLAELEALQARIDQIGDCEIGATVSSANIDEVMKIIRVWRRRRVRPGQTTPDTCTTRGPNANAPGMGCVLTPPEAE